MKILCHVLDLVAYYPFQYTKKWSRNIPVIELPGEFPRKNFRLNGSHQGIPGKFPVNSPGMGNHQGIIEELPRNG